MPDSTNKVLLDTNKTNIAADQVNFMTTYYSKFASDDYKHINMNMGGYSLLIGYDDYVPPVGS